MNTALCSDQDYKVTPDEVKAELGLAVEAEKEMTISELNKRAARGALTTCAFWGIDLVILTQRGNLVAFLKSLEDESRIKTRIAQYEPRAVSPEKRQRSFNCKTNSVGQN